MSTLSEYSKAFSHLLDPTFVEATYQRLGEHDLKNEQAKQLAKVIANSWFNASAGTDSGLGRGVSLATGFSQELYGPSATKAIAMICGLSVALQKMEVEEGAFYDEVDGAVRTLERVMADKDYEAGTTLRKLATKLMNFGGTLPSTTLDPDASTISTLVGRVGYSSSGHLSVLIDINMAKAVFWSEKRKVEEYLTDYGVEKYGLPHNFKDRSEVPIVVAYRDELEECEAVESLIDREVEVSLAERYVVPVRGDCQYTLVASTRVDPEPFTALRQELGLEATYSEDRPPRMTFGAVHTPDRVPIEAAVRGISQLSEVHGLIEKRLEELSQRTA